MCFANTKINLSIYLSIYLYNLSISEKTLQRKGLLDEKFKKTLSLLNKKEVI